MSGEREGDGSPAAGGDVTREPLVVVVNRKASSVSSRRIEEVREILGARFELDMVDTNDRGHARVLAAEAAARGAGAVVVLGGDGTQNEAANGLVGTSTALAVLPAGSTNVFARTIGLPNDTGAACRKLLDALERQSVRRVGLGTANGRHFLFHVGMGFDAAVVREVERRSSLKRLLGQPAFVIAGVSAWVGHDRRRPLLEVEADGRSLDGEGPAHLVVCLKTNPYTFLGKRPLDLAPDAGFDRGLAVVRLRTLALLPLLSVLTSAVGVGRPLQEHAGVDYSYDHTEVVVRGRAPFPWQVDGDFCGEGEEVVLRHVPDCLTLVVPP